MDDAREVARAVARVHAAHARARLAEDRVSGAIVTSQSRWGTWPPPIAKPFTIAITGFGMCRIALWSASTSVGRSAVVPAAPGA